MSGPATPRSNTEVARLTLRELNRFIARAEFRATEMRLAASLKKEAMKHLVWLETEREKLKASKRPSAAASERIDLVFKKRQRLSNYSQTRLDIYSYRTYIRTTSSAEGRF